LGVFRINPFISSNPRLLLLPLFPRFTLRELIVDTHVNREIAEEKEKWGKYYR